MSNVTVLGPKLNEELISARLLGPVWNWCLYGALVVQFYVYSYNFPRDNRYIKLLVYSIFFLETVQTVLSGTDLYYWFAAGFGNYNHIVMPFASFFDLPIMGSVVSLSVQLFFVHRIFVLSEKRSRWICVIICLLSVIGAVGAFGMGIYSYILDPWMGDLVVSRLVMTWIIANTLSDLLIASAMFYHLKRIWARDGKLSSHVLVSIVRVTIETNLVTTTVSFVTLLMVGLYPGWNWYVCPAYILGKLYSNTLLVSLNNRIAIRDKNEARGPIVDGQPMAHFENGAHPRSITDTMILEPENSQEERSNEPVAEAEVEERVNIPPPTVTVDVV